MVRDPNAKHERGLAREAVNSAAYWLFQPGERVMTCDGFPGVVARVEDGPYAGAEHYVVELDNGMGGGAYNPGDLSTLRQQTASTEHTAAEDYPELGSILHDRPDPATELVTLGSRTASVSCSLCGYSEGGASKVHPGDDCPYCKTPLTGQEYAAPVADGRFNCDNCGYSQGSSFRAVDACPMCKTPKVASAPSMGAGAAAFDGTHLWVASPGTSWVRQMDPNTGMVIRTVAVGSPAVSVTFDGAHIWVTGSDGSMTELNPFDGTMVRRLALLKTAECDLCDGDHDSLHHYDSEHDNGEGYHDDSDLDGLDDADDYHIEYGNHPHGGSGFLVHQNARPIFTRRSEMHGESFEAAHDEAHAAAHEHMNREGYFPNVHCTEDNGPMADVDHHTRSVQNHETRLRRQDDEADLGEQISEMVPHGDLLHDNHIGPTKYSSWVGKPCQDCGGPKEDQLDGGYTPICRSCWEQEAYQHGVTMGSNGRDDDVSWASPGVREHILRGIQDGRALAQNPTGPTKYSSLNKTSQWGQFNDDDDHWGDPARPGPDDAPSEDPAIKRTRGWQCGECGGTDHHTGQHNYGEPQGAPGTADEHVAYVHDGVFCKNCTEHGDEKWGKPSHLNDPNDPPGAISWRELRVKQPHGTTCDNCMKEIVPPRPHTEQECEDGDECSDLDPQHGEGHLHENDPDRAFYGSDEDRSSEDEASKFWETAGPADAQMKQERHQSFEDNAAEQLKDLGTPEQHHFLDTNPQGPSHYSMLIEAASDSDFRFHITAAWSDVRNKAKRIRSEGGVKVVAASNDHIAAEVKGDHHTYETILQYAPGTHKIAIWQCGCKWASYSWGRSGRWKRYEGRMCSHALATSFEAQSRGMFGAEVKADTQRPSWQRAHSPVTIEYDKGKDKNLNRRAVPPGNMKRTFSSQGMPCAHCGDGHDTIAEVLDCGKSRGENLKRFKDELDAGHYSPTASALNTLIREAMAQGDDPAEIVLAMITAGIDQPQMRFQAAVRTTDDAALEVGDPHWEDYESPDCHYCGGTDHTSAEHEVNEGWPTADEAWHVSQPRKLAHGQHSIFLDNHRHMTMGDTSELMDAANAGQQYAAEQERQHKQVYNLNDIHQLREHLQGPHEETGWVHNAGPDELLNYHDEDHEAYGDDDWPHAVTLDGRHKHGNLEMDEEDPGGGNGAGPESGEDEAEQMGDGTGTGIGGLGNAAASLHDEFLFEAPLRTEAAFLAPLIEALPELAGAGEAAAGAEEAGEGSSLLDKGKEIGQGANVLRHLHPHQDAAPVTPATNADTGQVTIDPNYQMHFSTWTPVPEGALPETDGELDLEGDQEEANTDPEAMNVTPAGSGGGSVASKGGWQAEVAAAAREHLAKTSMKTFSPAEQAAIINEGEGVRASNLDRLEITGTHYEALEAALGSGEDDDDLF
jgi:hypothetical protein